MLLYPVLISAALLGQVGGQCPRACKARMWKLNRRIQTLEKAKMSTAPEAGGLTGYGAIYIRWGRTACPKKSTTIYEGFAGGSWYSEGGGSSYLCLPYDPQWANFENKTQDCGSHMYGAEYQTCDDNQNVLPTNNANTDNLENHDVPCAVCQANSRPHQLMIPAKTECPTGWFAEYQGYLMASHAGFRRTEWTCVDAEPETRADSADNQNGALFYLVEAKCGSLPCPPYKEGQELTCVVCTR